VYHNRFSSQRSSFDVGGNKIGSINLIRAIVYHMLTMRNDLESNSSLREGLIPSKKPLKHPSSSCEIWKLLLCCSLFCFLGSYYYLIAPPDTVELTVSSLDFSSAELAATKPSAKWHIKPIHPHHHGSVLYMTEQTDQGRIYKRSFTAPCGDGMLVFNVGPAAEYEPFSYDVYDDAYAYSNNQGLCVLYPSYTGTQTSDEIMWEPNDPTERQVDLGDVPNKISTRVVQQKDTKENVRRGGDFLIIRNGNFYNPTYYKHLKAAVQGWPGDADIETMMQELVAELE
jgi:hypothetical protein